jgi:hypothetical protein
VKLRGLFITTATIPRLILEGYIAALSPRYPEKVRLAHWEDYSFFVYFFITYGYFEVR